MCLHGFSQSGHVQLAFSSAARAREQGQLAGGNTSSMSRGISSASNCASGSARAAIAFSIRRHCCSVRALLADPHAIGRVARALHFGDHDAGLDFELDHLATARIVAPALQPRADAERLEQPDEPLRPPGIADRAPLAAGRDPALDPQRPRRLPIPPVRPLVHAALLHGVAGQGHELTELRGVELGDPPLAACRRSDRRDPSSG